MTKLSRWIVVVAVAFITAPRATAEVDRGTPLEYVRVFVPAEHPAEWPLDGEKYIPVAAEEFERLIKLAQYGAEGETIARRCRVKRLSGVATYSTGQLRGQVTLSVTLEGDGPALLPLEPWGLPVLSAGWQGERETPAVFGATTGNRTAVYVERSGDLRLEFALHAAPDAAGACEFPIVTPSAVSAHWEVLAGPEVVVAAREGIVRVAAAEAGLQRRWSIDAAPGAMLHLTCAKLVSASAAEVAVAAKTTYVFSTNGVDVVADWKLEGNKSGAPLRVRLEEPLEVATVQVSGKESACQRRDGGIEIDVPDAASQVRITAWCPLSAGVHWNLPRIQPLEFTWSEQDLDLVIPEPLGLKEITSASGMLQTRAGKLPAPLAGDSLSFHCYAASAQLALKLDYLAPRVDVLAGISVDMGPRETTARAAYELAGRDGETFALNARVGPGWLIEDIRSVPADRLGDFERSASTADELRVRLASALKSRERLQLIVTARRLNPREGESVPLVNLTPLTWESADKDRTLFSLTSSAEQHWRLELADNALPLSRTDLSAAERELLPSAAEETLVALNDSNRGADVLAELRPRAFRAKLAADFLIDSGQLAENYAFDIVPEQGAVDVFLTRFSEPRNAALNWSGEAANPVIVTAERVDLGDGGASPGETWRVRLWPPQTAPFRIRAERTTPATPTMKLSLIAVPNATTTEATASVRSPHESILDLHVSGPRPFMIPGRDPVDGKFTVRDFLYDPARDVDETTTAALSVALQPRDLADSVLVRKELLTTSVQSDGSWYVHTHYELESALPVPWEVRIPPDAKALRCTCLGETASFTWRDGRLTVPLRIEGRRSEVDIEYSVSRPSATSAYRAPAPEVARASHRREWRLYLPRDLEIAHITPPWSIENRIPGRWAAALFGPLARGSDQSLFMPWRERSWHELTSESASEGPGYLITGPAKDAPELQLRSPSASRWAMLFAALAAGAVVAKVARARPYVLAAAPAVAAVAAFLFQGLSEPIFAGVFVGTVGAAVINAAARLRMRDDRPEAATDVGSLSTRTVVITASLGLAGIIFCEAGSLRAADAPQEGPLVYRVLIPTDENDIHLGDRYFVPSEMWLELRRRAAALGEERPQWLVTSAQYTNADTSAAWEPTSEWTARYDMISFAPDTPVTLPWSEQVVRQVLTASLDGNRIPLPNAGRDSALAFRLREPGAHRLELRMRPVVSANADSTSSHLSLPANPLTQLTLRAGDAEIEQLAKASPGPTERMTGSATTRSGPLRELMLKRASGTTAPRVATVELEQLVWLHVAPERVTAEVRHQIIGAAQPLARIDLGIDPRWTVIPQTSASEASAAETIALQWNPPRTVGERFNVRLQLNSNAGLGELSYPLVEPKGAIVRRRWCAVTLDPALEMTSLVNAVGTGTSAAPFASAWGEVATEPDRVFTWPLGAPTPNFQTAFRAARTVCDESLQATVYTDRLDLLLEAALETTGLGTYSLRIEADKNLVVKSINVLQDGAQQAARWARGDDGSIRVFLNAAALGRYQLQLQGTVPTTDERVTLPKLGVADAEITARTVRLARHASVRVDEVTPTPQVANDSAESATDSLKSLGQWTLPRSHEPISLRRIANQPRIDAVQLITLSPGKTSWSAEVDCLLSVNDGAADSFAFELDPSWQGPFTLSPAWPHQITARAGSRRQLLVVNAPTPQQGDLRLTIRGTLHGSGNALATLPNVSPRGVSRLQRFAALAERDGSRNLTWDVQGLRPTPLPTLWGPSITGRKGYRTYELSTVAAQANARLASDSVKRPQVELADYTLRVEDDGSYRARARWLLQPEGITELPLHMPSGSRPLGIKIFGREVTTRASVSGEMMLPLLSDRLPQEVEILYAGDALPADGAPYPEFSEVTVSARQFTLLTGDSVTLKSSGDHVTELAAAMDRLRSVAKLINSATDVKPADAIAEAEQRAHLSALMPTLALARSATQRAIADEMDRAKARAAEREMEQLDQRLNSAVKDRATLAPILAELPALTKIADEELEQTRLPSGKTTTRLRSTTNDGGPRLSIAGASPLSAAVGRVGVTLCLAILSAALFWSDRYRTALARLAPHPAFVLFGCGAIWWWLLTPSLLGVGIMALAGVLTLRRGSAGNWRPAPATR